MYFPKLYKLTATGKVQEWEISTEQNVIIVIQGQLNGKKQKYEEVIHKGKNLGRENETTPTEQAEAEAQSKWDKKHNKDYHLSIEDCLKKGKIANRGGYLPMLAQSFDKHADKHLIYPCYVQPKLDGLRCTATREYGAKLWFRSGKEITTMNHIVDDLQNLMARSDIYDGELYIHGEDFNSFTGAIRANKNLNPEITKKIKYHIYDFPKIFGLVEQDTYKHRLGLFQELALPYSSIVRVKTILVNNFEEAMDFYEECINDGYEGIMFRNLDMPYEQKRSYNLLKYKKFIDDEFIIIGGIEGKGILAGHVGSFICRIEAGRVLNDIGGKTFTFGKIKGEVRAKMDGKTEYLKHLFNNPNEWIGKPLTIKYQNLSKDGIPRFPVGKTIRFDK